MNLPLLAYVLATASPSPSPTERPPIDPSTVGPGLLGGISITFLAIAVFFLYRSLTRQMRKVDPALPTDDEIRGRRSDEDDQR